MKNNYEILLKNKARPGIRRLIMVKYGSIIKRQQGNFLTMEELDAGGDI